MLYLYQSNRLEALARILAEQLAGDPLPPLVQEEVVTPHPGMARWLSLRLAESSGICADVDFALPAGFIWRILGSMVERRPEENRFDPQVLLWSILQQLPKLSHAREFAPVSRYLADGDPAKAYQFATRLARIFDRYLVYRPDWIAEWEGGRSTVVGDDWQRLLWQAIAGEEPHHWARLGLKFREALAEGRPPAVALPSRISLFGVSNLSPGYLQIIALLSRLTDIHLYLLNPSKAYWADLVQPWEKERKEIEADGRELFLELGNPLLASLCKQGQQLFAALDELRPGDGAEIFAQAEGDSLLARLQNELTAADDGPAAPHLWNAQDRSLQLHSCHGAMREVEVLYDQLLELFARRPELQPDQVLVMTPDLDTYAPLIDAVFGEPGDRPPIPYALADRGPDSGALLVERFFDLFELADHRYALDRVAALFETPAVARRFGIEEDDLPEVIGWLHDAGIRWGRDAEHRGHLGLPADERNTWRAGLDRLLMGYAMEGGQHQLFRGILPFESIEGLGAERLGGVVDFIDRLFELEPLLEEEHPPAEWAALLHRLIDRFFVSEGAETEQLQGLREAIDQWLHQARLGGFERPCRVGLVLPHLRTLIDGAAANRHFLAGGVTFCGLTANRILPSEVICLIGMNDGSFPRDQRPAGFDLMARRWRFGDRSPRLEDRYLFLETLVSARRTLYLSYVGQDQRDNSERPPSVVLSELLDYLDACHQPDGEGRALRQRLVVRHPLQPFSRRYFGDEPGLFSYSAARREAALTEPQGTAGDICSQPLPDPQPLADWLEPELDEFLRFFAHPLRWFCTRRLGLVLQGADEELDPREPMAIGFFEGHELECRLLEILLDERPIEPALEVELASQQLPHGSWGRVELAHHRQLAEGFVTQVRALELGELEKPPRIDVQLGEIRLHGAISGVRDGGLVYYHVRRPWPGDELQWWIRHLALNRVRGGCTSRWIHPEGAFTLAPVTDAESILTDLAAIYRDALNRPPVFFRKTARAFAEAERDPKKGEEDALRTARRQWEGNSFQGTKGESADAWNALLFPDGAFPSEPFMDLARRIWGPLLDHLEA